MEIYKRGLAAVSISVLMLVVIAVGCSSKKVAEKRDAVKEFSADIISKTKGTTAKGKIYVTKDKVRVDMPEASVITNHEKKHAWTLFHKRKKYIKHELKPEHGVIGIDRFPDETQRIIVGSEAIGDVNATKYKITYNAGGEPQTVYQWINDDTGVPLKTSSVDGNWSQELSNVKAAPPDPDLFKVPDGYDNVTGQFDW